MDQTERAVLKAEKKAEYKKKYQCMNAFWLCSFLGFFGIHRFYVGKIGTGLLQLITLGGFFIWWSVDLYKIIRGRFTDGKGNVISWYVPEQIAGQHNFAGFRVRATALFIDSYVIMAVFLPLSIGMIAYAIIIGFDPVKGINESLIEKDSTYNMLNNISNILSYAFGFAYSVYFHGSKHQGTIGKRAVGIYLLNRKGERLSYFNAVGRYFSTIISYLTLCIGFAMAGWTEKKQALHDMIAGTYVVYGKPSDTIILP